MARRVATRGEGRERARLVSSHTGDRRQAGDQRGRDQMRSRWDGTRTQAGREDGHLKNLFFYLL